MNPTDRVGGPKPSAPVLPLRAMTHAEEIASAAGVCLETARRWIKAGHFRGAVKIGRRYLVPRAAVAEALGLANPEAATGSAS